MVMALLMLGSAAGMWVWTVKNRGEWNLVAANGAGAFSGFFVGMLLASAYATIFEPGAHPKFGHDLVEMLTTAGVGVGTWMFISRGAHPPLKQMLLHLGGGAAGLVTASLVIAMLPMRHVAGQ